MMWHGKAAPASLAKSSNGSARFGTAAPARLDMAALGTARQARHGCAGLGLSRLGMARLGSHDRTRRGTRLDEAGGTRRGKTLSGQTRPDGAGKAWLDKARLDTALTLRRETAT